MNIREAAAQLEQAVRAYTARTPEGAYRITLAAQRPVYLVGPPGVGKTAAVAQVARRMGIGYAAYTMTHHTRQSALGLPMIVHRTLNGEDRAVTEYTVSEIVADVWQKAEAGAETGILFLDEINCVSESLMPAMLQLLQYKTFGVHALPRGWIVVCAGNPPKYNRYAHTFDAVAMDRLRVIGVEPDYDAWRVFAVEQGTHPVIRSYLELRREDFYVSDGDRIVTARSWSDLSDMMVALEATGERASEALFGQYLQVEDVAGRFARYVKLCEDLDERLEDALAGGAWKADLPFDEAVFAALLLAGRLHARADMAAGLRRDSDRMGYFVDGVAREAAGTGKPVDALCREQLDRLEAAHRARLKAGLPDEAGASAETRYLSGLKALSAEVRGMEAGDALRTLRQKVNIAAVRADAAEEELVLAMGRDFDFVETHFADPNVRLIYLNDIRAHEATNRLATKRLKLRLDALAEGCDPQARAKRL